MPYETIRLDVEGPVATLTLNRPDRLNAFSTKPVIAAINGPAVGVGATMTLPMDIRLISDRAKIGFVFAGRGIVIDGAASWFLPGFSPAWWALTRRSNGA